MSTPITDTQVVGTPHAGNGEVHIPGSEGPADDEIQVMVLGIEYARQTMVQREA